MGVIDYSRRWLKDQLTHDENIDGTPEEKIKFLTANLKGMTVQERRTQVEHLKAYVDYYYVGHQNEAVPPKTKEEMRQLERTAEKMNLLDMALKTLDKFGGPPTRETVLDAVERSYKERAKEHQKDHSHTNTYSASYSKADSSGKVMRAHDHSKGEEHTAAAVYD